MPSQLQKIRQNTIQQTLTTLRNRVNELGISEPLVQQQGMNRISVDLPGVQDSNRAKKILGGTATLQFHLVAKKQNVSSIFASGIAPPGTQIYHMQDQGQPILLNSDVVLSGNSITNASSSFDRAGQPSVSISLGGGGESYFNKITRDHIGQRMAIVYVSTVNKTRVVDGKAKNVVEKKKQVISAPVIQSALGSRFQITGLESHRQARNLALMLRSGAMPVNVHVAEERTVGASLGQQNIQQGMRSVEVAFLLIIVFMAVYYRVFGLIADLALGVNLLLLLAILSILGATLTLPGIAGIVLTVGMAVDANVLIFERIREELRNGTTTQASIHAGFERAFSTIVDANVTTLIVAVVLFSIGSGPIKGFAVTLSIGLLTSMFTAITFTRGLVNALYGGKSQKQLSIGIKY
jgi:preprotein translocase subunit SecD